MTPPAPPSADANATDATDPAAAGGARFLALGDSYTIGEGVAEAERWPVRLAADLRAEGVAVQDPTIVAVTGWTTDELDAAIDRAVAEGEVSGTYGLVTLLIGVNNQYRGRPVADYRAELRALLARAVAFAGGDERRVVVLSIPDWGVMPFAADRDRGGISRAIDAFNAAARAEAIDAGAAWVDVTGLSRAHPAETAPDGLHPSGAQYARWAEAARAAARAALGAR